MAAPLSVFAKHPYATQVCLVTLLSAVLTYATAILNFRTPWNGVWMILIPFVLGFVFNRDAERGSFMAMVLMSVSLLTVMAAGFALGGM